MMEKFLIFGFVFVILSMLVFGFTACSNPHTPTGHEGYVFEDPRLWGNGGFRGQMKGPRNFGLSLWNNNVINIDMRAATYTEEFVVLAKDDLKVSFRVHAVIDIDSNTVGKIVENYGAEHWYMRFVREPFRTMVRESVQNYASRDIKARYEELSENIGTKIRRYLKETPFNLIQLSVGNIQYPEVVAQAVEKKLAAEQLLEEKSVQKEIAKRDAEIQIEEAKGIAEAQKIINETLTANYLQHEAIQAQKIMANSPNHTTVYIPVGSNGLPLVHNR